jgi:hypothetical protein
MCSFVPAAQSNPIHCVTDISHEFTFYFDGRFGKNYVMPNGINVRNWGTLHKYDFQHANLLILQSSGTPCVYSSEDIQAVEACGHLGEASPGIGRGCKCHA